MLAKLLPSIHDSSLNPLICAEDFTHHETFKNVAQLTNYVRVCGVVKTGSTQQQPISRVMEINADRNDTGMLENNIGRPRKFSGNWEWAQD